ncbi:MAG: T9SS type A sorting domain-containing protein [Chitinophagales bacterium]
MNRSLPVILLLTFMVSTLWAQTAKVTNYTRCVTDEYQESLRNQYPQMPTKQDFESWMAAKVAEKKANPNQRLATIKIPYVVHVVHGGQPIGTGPNITAAQVNAQIQQINDDFRRENSDASNTPADFLPVAAAWDVEFVPAVVDPNGNIMAEPGINRVNGNAEFGVSGTWSTGAIDATLKPGTIWDRSLYMNVWSADISGGILGYAQFPSNSTLPGFAANEGPATTDGVVIAYGTLGSLALPGSAGAYGYGRTLTHELGHWAGLRHIWGDGGGDDFCDDTPCAGSANFTGEPCTYPGPNSCTDPGTDLPDMFQNYMDYSDDACFNLFTADQVTRFEVVFENSPGRNDLINSTTWQFPSADTIIAGIDKDASSGCAPLVVTFSDNSYIGDSADAVTSYEWNFDVNSNGGASPSTFSGETPPAVTFSSTGTYTISLTIDNGVYTSTASTTVTVEGAVALDIIMGFESGIPATWTNDTWIESSSVGFNSGASIYQDNWNNSGSVPAYLSTPSIDMDVSATTIELTFDVAHAYYGGGFGENEGLAVEISTDCGATWTEIWKKLDSDAVPFYTAQSTALGWEPASDEWRAEEIDLTSYKGNGNVRVRFHGISDWGNDTYIDNIQIKGITVDPNSIEAEFTSDVDVICVGQSANFTNTSTVGAAVTDAVYQWDFDANSTGSATPASFTGATPPSVSFGSSGIYTVELTVSSVIAGTSDTYTLDLDVGGALPLPYAEDFESGAFPGDLTADDGWLSSFVAFGGSTYGVVADNFNEEDLVADLTLPSLDFSAVGRATFSFDLAHTYYAGLFGNLYDTLQISYSLDCGASWTPLWRKDDGDPLNPLYTVEGGAGGEFAPASDDDWRKEEIDVTFLKGNDNVKLRFENRGAFGNQLYLDNINVDAELVADDEVFAYFVTDAASGCVGSAITFTDQSTPGANTTITSWEWNFDVNGTGTASPATYSGQTPPAVSFDEPGIYEVELVVSDGSVSDDYVVQISIEVPYDLTYTQDFSAAAFPPVGWTNSLWEQAIVSTDPLLGSMFADNWGVSGLKASMQTPSFDMSWYDQIAMTFDVAHGRFSTFENEGLVINYSTDCASSWTEVWSKYDFDADPLYTVPGTGGEFIPANASEWREETVDLSSLNDFSSVKLELFNDGFFGNNTFVDDIKIEGWLFNPTELTATLNGTNNIDLTWVDNSGKEAAYEVLRKSGSGDFVVIATLGADATSYTDEGLSGVTTYTYQVCAYNEKARACSNEDSETTEPILVVSGLVATLSATNGTSIELHWDDLSTTEDGFLIKRSDDGFATFTVINVLTANQNYYLDEFLEETTTYTYQVCAFNDLDTVESNLDDATTEINAPTNLTATTVGVNIALGWSDNSIVEEGYQIKRALASGGPYTTVATVGPNVNAYTDFNLQSATEYCYVVCAFNAIAVACSDEECSTTDVASSIFDDLNVAITMYPNPASDYFELQLSSVKGQVDVKIYNQIGELMSNQIIDGGSAKRVDIKEFAAGVYLVRLQTAEGYTTKKLVVE